MYYSDSFQLVQLIIPLIFLFIISIIFSIFSPLGICFIVFSIIRLKTENKKLKEVSLAFQIILASLNFLIGILISLIFVIKGSPFYVYSSASWLSMLAVIFGVCFVCIVFLAIIVWETKILIKKDQD